MADDGKTLDDITLAAKQDLGEALDEWAEGFMRDTSDLETFPTIDEIEGALLELNSKTRDILLRMVSDGISSIDEREAIDAKKES